MPTMSKAIEESAALRVHNRALKAGEEYAQTHGHSIIEDVAYGRGYKSGYMSGSVEMYQKMVKFMKEKLEEHIWYDEMDRDCGLDDDFYELLEQEMSK